LNQAFSYFCEQFFYFADSKIIKINGNFFYNSQFILMFESLFPALIL
jgi:hypothetical protein